MLGNGRAAFSIVRTHELTIFLFPSAFPLWVLGNTFLSDANPKDLFFLLSCKNIFPSL